MELTFHFKWGVLDGATTERDFDEFPPIGIEFWVGFCVGKDKDGYPYTVADSKTHETPYLYIVERIRPGPHGDLGHVYCRAKRTRTPTTPRRSER